MRRPYGCSVLSYDTPRPQSIHPGLPRSCPLLVDGGRPSIRVRQDHEQRPKTFEAEENNTPDQTGRDDRYIEGSREIRAGDDGPKSRRRQTRLDDAWEALQNGSLLQIQRRILEVLFLIINLNPAARGLQHKDSVLRIDIHRYRPVEPPLRL